MHTLYKYNLKFRVVFLTRFGIQNAISPTLSLVNENFVNVNTMFSSQQV